MSMSWEGELNSRTLDFSGLLQWTSGLCPCPVPKKPGRMRAMALVLIPSSARHAGTCGHSSLVLGVLIVSTSVLPLTHNGFLVCTTRFTHSRAVNCPSQETRRAQLTLTLLQN